MFKRLATIAILAGAAAVIPAGPAAAEQHCGTVAANRQTVRVAVRGRVSCRRARNIAKSYISGRGTFHPARSYGATTITIPGGWICRSEEGGSAGCFSGGSPQASATLALWSGGPGSEDFRPTPPRFSERASYRRVAGR